MVCHCMSISIWWPAGGPFHCLQLPRKIGGGKLIIFTRRFFSSSFFPLPQKKNHSAKSNFLGNTISFIFFSQQIRPSNIGMRRLFGGTPPRPPSADVPHHKQQQQQQQANNHQHNNVTPSKKKHSTGGEGGTRHAFTSLRNSLRRLSSSSKTLTQQQQQRQHVAAEDTNNDEEATRNTNNNMNNGRLLSPSRTFDGRYRYGTFVVKLLLRRQLRTKIQTAA